MPIQSLVNPVFISVDGAGRANAGGTVGVYTADGLFTTLATIYSDQTKTSQLANPITLDAAGTKEFWYDVKVDIQEKTAAGVLIRDTLNIDPNAAAEATTGFNLAQNGSFETDADADGIPDGWTISPYTGSLIAISSTIATDGDNSLEFNTGGASTGGGTATSAKFPVTQGTAVEIQWAFYASSETTTNTFQIKWYDELDALQSTSTVTMPTSGVDVPTTWTNYYERVAVDAAGTKGEIILTGINSSSTTPSAKAYFDGIKVTQVPTLEPVIYDSVGNEVIKTAKVASAVNEITVTNAATTINPKIQSSGEATTGLIIGDSTGNEVIIAETGSASAVNEITVTNAIAGAEPSIAATGDDTDIGIDILAKGADTVNINNAVKAVSVASQANGVRVTSTTTGLAPVVDTYETNTNINIAGNGTGVVELGGTAATHTGQGYGGRVLIETQTASASASIEFTSGIDSTYKIYEIEFINVIPSTGDDTLNFVVSHDTGSTWEDDGVVGTYRSASTNTNVAGIAGPVESTANRGGACGTIYIYDPSSSSVYTHIRNSCMWLSNANAVEDQAGATSPYLYQSATAIDGFKLSFTTQTIASGEFRLYGVIA